MLPDSFNFFLPLTSLTLLVFYVVAAVYLIFTIIFYYHWNQYSVNLKMTTLTYLLYSLTTLPLILALAKIALTA